MNNILASLAAYPILLNRKKFNKKDFFKKLLILTHSSTVIAKGFSQKTCFWDFKTYKAWSQCKLFIEAIHTHLISVFFKISSKDFATINLVYNLNYEKYSTAQVTASGTSSYKNTSFICF